MSGDFLFTCPFCHTAYNGPVFACSCPKWQESMKHITTYKSEDEDISSPSTEIKNRCKDIPTEPQIVWDKNNTLGAAITHKDTLVVNLFAGPGAGKSTTAAGIFYELKSRNINCELVQEFAKDLVWEERNQTLDDQIYIFGKQYHRIFRLLGKVKVVITDSPLLFTIVYDKEERPTLAKLVVEEHEKTWHYNAFIKRKKLFQESGRKHNEKECMGLDLAIMDMLDNYKQCYEVFEGTPEGKDKIVKKILQILFNKIKLE